MAVGGRLVVPPSIAVEVVDPGVPAAPVGFDDQPMVREQHVDVLALPAKIDPAGGTIVAVVALHMAAVVLGVHWARRVAGSTGAWASSTRSPRIAPPGALDGRSAAPNKHRRQS